MTKKSPLSIETKVPNSTSNPKSLESQIVAYGHAEQGAPQGAHHLGAESIKPESPAEQSR